MLDRFGMTDFAALQQRLVRALSEGTQFIAGQALSIGQNTFEFVASLCITLYLAFFLIRDGAEVARTLRHAIPLAPAHKRELLAKFATVIRATVKGNLLVAAIQGALGGVAFWFLGVSGALLWGVLMAFLSLLPAVGAGLVWLPVAVYFLVTGAIWQALALSAWGVLVIGLIDNLLRPILVGKDTQMPDYVVMITTLGGMAVFGINGFVIGPVIAAMFIAVWHIYGVTQSDPAA
jgi:predicted PurR-regulated permease PerM